MWFGPSHTSAYVDDGNTYTVGNPTFTNKFATIYNDNAGNGLSPVSYQKTDTNNVNYWNIFYTNKLKNRLWIWWNDGEVKGSEIWGFKERATKTDWTRGTCGVLTRGYNLESELENTSRNWYNKCLIKQNRIYYDFTSGEKTVEKHKMVDGVPLFYFDKQVGDEFEDVEITFSISSTLPSNKKYIVFSKKPITLSSYSTNVDSDENYEQIKSLNGTEFTSVKRKAELINGKNVIKLSNKDFKSDDILYFKILWNTTNTYGGTNYDDEAVIISDPTLEMQVS